MPPPEMRRAAPGKAAPNRNIDNSSYLITDETADRQASQIARLYLVGYATASAIAHLAWGVAR
ncbi:hypothetical protein ABIE89_006491 [Bradyrhizobium niftali]